MKEFLDYAWSKYDKGEPVMSDEEFDALASLHNYESVGVKMDLTAVPHFKRMYSLEKCYVGEPAIVLKGGVITESPKLDGAAVSLFYVDGKFVRGLSRGDGIKGEDITDNLRSRVPETIPGKIPTQITGEVVAPKDIPNSRNYVAGALRLKDVNEANSRDLTFVAYGVYPPIGLNWSEDMKILEETGDFKTVLSEGLEIFPTDGVVHRLDDHSKFDAMGYTSMYPRGAFALKQNAEGVITTLLDVIWQVGRTGSVTPVAILEPVNIGGAQVSRASLHNPGIIEQLGIEIGCQVEVIRAGEIIPQVVRRV